jgi:hypothetical protein
MKTMCKTLVLELDLIKSGYMSANTRILLKTNHIATENETIAMLHYNASRLENKI